MKKYLAFKHLLLRQSINTAQYIINKMIIVKYFSHLTFTRKDYFNCERSIILEEDLDRSSFAMKGHHKCQLK